MPQGHLPILMHTQAYVSGQNFKGVKMVPPGAHFVSSNAVSSRGIAAAAGGGSDVAPTASFFVELALRQVVIRRWDRQEELLLPLDDPDEVCREILWLTAYLPGIDERRWWIGRWSLTGSSRACDTAAGT